MNDCCNGDIPDEEPIHMFVDAGYVACDTNIWDGRISRTTGDFKKVTCDDCRIKYGEYVIKQQEEQIADLSEELARQREKVRVAEQATGMVRRDLRRATLRVFEQEKTIRALRQDIDHLRGGSQYYAGRTRPRGYPY